jgi:type I restriction enzyme S subunit
VTEATRPLALEVPTLRFPEFSSCWKNARLADIVVGGFSNGVFNDPAKVGSGYRLINVKDMYLSGTINSNNLERVAISENEFRKNVAKIGDIFFTRSSLVKEGIAYSNVLLEELDDITYDGHLIKMSVDQNIFDSFFLHNLLKTDSARRQLVARGKTGTMTTIGQDDLSSVKLTYPALPEQQKIADFLGAVDTRVGLLRRRRDALRAFKKGMMQRLFSQELRFTKPDGSPFPDWQEKRLGEIASEKFSNGVFNDPQLVGTGYRLINVKDMFEGNQIALHSLHLVAIDEREFLKNRAKKGDIFFTRSSLVKEGIAYSNVLLEDAEDVTFDGHLIRLRPDQRVCIPRFLAAQLRHGSLRRQLVARGKTGTMTTIGQEDLSTVRVALPHPEEQQKIADTLTALDTKIDAVTAQIDAMLRFKKGLLQQMFV